MSDKILLDKLKIVGRTKKHMDTLLMTMGGVLIPLDFYLLAEYPELQNHATTVVFVGLAAWLSAYYIVRKKEKRKKTERQEDRKEYTIPLTKIHKDLEMLHSEKTTKCK